MSIKTIFLGVIVEEEISSAAAIDYAAALADHARAHLSCRIATPTLHIAGGALLGPVRSLADRVNAERLARADGVRDKIQTACRLSGVPTDCEILQAPFTDARDGLTAAARASDIVVLPQPAGALSLEQGIVEGVLFGAGRPAIVAPAQSGRAQFRRILVAWDGGARAARAIGDAMPLLEGADAVEVVSIVPDLAKSAAGADIAAHLSRHCRRLELTDLAPQGEALAGVERTLLEHVRKARPDLVVMGAYAHSRLTQFVLGGATSTMLAAAPAPVLYAC